jgi:hypothetical protein
MNQVAQRVDVAQSAPIPPSADPKRPPRRFDWPESGKKPQVMGQSVELPQFPDGAAGLKEVIKSLRHRPYEDPAGIWAQDRVANALGYRLLTIAAEGRANDAEAAIWSIADAVRFGDSVVLGALAEGLERHGEQRLATIAYSLDWTRARGRGGSLTFGGATRAESLHRACQLDRNLTLDVVAQEVEHVIATSRYGTNGLSQALIYAFATVDLAGSAAASRDVAFDAWANAFDVVAWRTPRTHPSDDPTEQYVTPTVDDDTFASNQLDAALVVATIAGLAHPWRENKRRSLMAAQLLIGSRPGIAAPAIELALTNLSDAATLTWLLRILDVAGHLADPIVEYCQGALTELTTRPELTVRAVARRILTGRTELSTPPVSAPDRALLTGGFGQLWVPQGTLMAHGTASPETEQLVEEAAGCRLYKAESHLPGLDDAVKTRVDEAMSEDANTKRLKRQLESFTNRVVPRWPDAFLVQEETVESCLQRAAAGGRAARVACGEPIYDPVEWESALAAAILDDPLLPLHLEATRQPRIPIPPPPPLGDGTWREIARSESGVANSDALVYARAADGVLAATLAVKPLDELGCVVSGQYAGWRVFATEERLMHLSRHGQSSFEYIAKRYRAPEVHAPRRRAAVESASGRCWQHRYVDEVPRFNRVAVCE